MELERRRRARRRPRRVDGGAVERPPVDG